MRCQTVNYEVRFTAKLAGTKQWVYVGDRWLSHTSATGNMIKEVCGSYPSAWNGRKCKDILPILKQGISLLSSFPYNYREYEPENSWGTVETTLKFLEKIAANCEEYPTALIEVRC